MICQPYEVKYKVPKGSRAKGEFCLDKDVDKESVDKINQIKTILPTSFCDGGKHTISSAIGHKQGQALLVFHYKGNNDNRLIKFIKPLCSTSKVNIIKLDEKYNLHPILGDSIKEEIFPCTNVTKKYKKDTKEESEYKRKLDPEYAKLKIKPRTVVTISSKSKNSKNWWKQTATILQNLQLKQNKKPLNISKNIKTNYGEASIIKEKIVKPKPKIKSDESFLGLGAYL